MSSESNLPTLGQGVAMAHTYRRMLPVVGTPPLTVMLAPFVLKSVIFVLDQITAGYGILALALSLLFMLEGYHLIHTLASTREKMELAFAKNAIRLPVGSLIAGVLVSRYVVAPIVSWVGIPFLSIPIIGFLDAFRLAAALACLGLAVVARYLGPNSISK